MILSLDVMRARKGDCLIVHFGTTNKRGMIMIDGGPKSVYTPHLKPRLMQIRTARGIAQQQSLPVDLLMVSHVDDDHIHGILDLTKEMVEAKDAHRPQLLKVLGFWHNSFDEIIGNTPDELTAAMTAQFGTASLSDGLPVDASLPASEIAGLEEETIGDTLKVLASIDQGHRLRKDAEKLQFPLNSDFNGKLVMATDGEEIDIGNELTFTVVGPMKPELKKLQAKHDEWLRELKKKGKSPPAALAAYVDKSVPNLSSIVVLAKAGGKKMLLTGDARGDKILEGLQMVGLLGAGTTSKMHVDLLKVPHHGSDNNLDVDFFERITADHYVFSGNGEHGNPEREALQMLFNARGDKPFTMHFTYPIEEIDTGRKKEHEKKAVWSRPKHSLAAFFEGKDLAGKGQKISTINSDTDLHVIDLLDPVGL